MPADTLTPQPDLAPGVEEKIVRIGADLAQTIRAVLDLVPADTRRPQELAKACGLNKDVAYRVLKAVQQADPIVVTHLIPGPAPLRKLLRGARKLGVEVGVLAPAEEAVDRFETLIERDAGDRGSLDVIISGWLPEVREKTELLSRQNVYRGISQIKGASVEVLYDISVLVPNPDDRRLADGVFVRGLRGLTRGRRDATVRFANRLLEPPAGRPPSMTLDGRPIRSLDDTILQEFSDPPSLRAEKRTVGGSEYFCLAPDAIGADRAVDVVVAEFNPGCVWRYAPPGKSGRSGPYSEIHLPARLSVFDVLVHRDLFPGSEPALAVYDTAIDGLANINDPARDADRIDVLASLLPIGHSPSGLRVLEIPRYDELLRSVFAARGWNAEEFRVYRCRMPFPVYGSQICVSWECPQMPAEG